MKILPLIHIRFLDVWGVGYSCVLFALMTVSLLTDHSPCSVNFFGICFPTYQIPIPFTRIRIPVNLFPFVQLILMKVLIPNSSLLGHLSGILLGYYVVMDYSIDCCSLQALLNSSVQLDVYALLKLLICFIIDILRFDHHLMSKLVPLTIW